MRESLTISLSPPLRRKLDRATREEGVGRSDLVREALQRYLAAREFHRLRGLLVPLAERRRLFTDEDIFQKVS